MNMENTTTCFSCDFILDKVYKFCPSCGTNIKCKNCDTLLTKGAKFCFNCGNSIHGENQITTNENINTIKFKETKDEREYEVRFTNETASQVTSVVAGMIPSSQNIFTKDAISNNLISYEKINDLSPDLNKNVYETSIIDNKSEEQIINNLSIDEMKTDLYPHIDDLPLKYEGFTEKDWILIYAFYLSKFGEISFTRKQVLEKYKEVRKTENRMKKFSENWNITFKENFKTLKDDQLFFLSKGIQNVKFIMTQDKNVSLNNKVNSNKIKKVQNKITSNKTTNTNVKIEEFDIYKEIGLEKIIEKTNAKSTKEYILSIGYYINFILKNEYFTDGNIDYAFKNLKLPNRPNTLRQIITNIKNNDFWIDKVDKKHWKLTRKGELEFEK